MKRSFGASQLVSLPRLSAATAVALFAAIQADYAATAKAQKIPAAIAKAFPKLTAAGALLRQSYSEKVRAANVDPLILKAADIKVDSCYAALESFVAGWNRLPALKADLPKVAAAKRVHKALFSAGLRFTQAEYRVEWAESQARLDIIDASLSDDLTLIGADPFIGALRPAHQEYGDLQGLSKSKPEVSTPRTRADLDAFADALRTYVIKVTATIDEDDATTSEIAAALLASVAQWENSDANDKPAGDDSVDPSAPVVAPATPVAAAPAIPAPAPSGTQLVAPADRSKKTG